MTKEQKIIRAKVGLAGAGQAARQRQPGLQDDGLLAATASTGSRSSTTKAASWRCRRSPGKKPILKNRVAAGDRGRGSWRLPLEQPAFGQIRVANELRKRGLFDLAGRRARRLAAP